MNKASLTMIFLTLIWGCGSQSKDSKPTAASATTVKGHCLITGSHDQAGLSSTRCVDYENMNPDLVEATANSCTDKESELESGTYVQDSLCEDEGKLGGCRFPSADGILVTSWTYTSGQDVVDASVVELAKDACEASTNSNDVKANWTTP